MNRIGPLKPRTLGAATTALAVVVCVWAATAARAAADIETEFKDGTIGTEVTVGVPYWLWIVLPEVFADKLPNRPGSGYARLGFTYETPASDLPIGTTKSTDWIPRVGLNCATCHVGNISGRSGAPPRIVLGMPAHQMDLQGYARFLSAVAKDPRFTADTLVAAMKKHAGFGFTDGLVYKFFVISRVKDAISSATRGSPGSTSGRPRARAASTRSIRTRRCSRRKRTSTPTTRWAPPICRRSGISGCGRDCGSIGMVTTIPWRSATRARRSAPGRLPTPSILPRSIGSRTGFSISSRPRFPGSHRRGTGGRRQADLPAELRELSRHRPAARRPGHRHRRCRHRPRARAIVHAGTGRADEHHRYRQAVALLAFQEDQRLRRACRSTASGCARRICTMDRCRRCARCCCSTNAPRGSTARMTCTTGARWASCRADQRPRKRASRSTRLIARQRQRWPHLRPRPVHSGSRSADRVSQDALTWHSRHRSNWNN